MIDERGGMRNLRRKDRLAERSDYRERLHGGQKARHFAGLTVLERAKRED
jgi:hypothetical protein